MDVDGVFSRLQEILGGCRHLTRRALAGELGEAGSTWSGEQLGHLLLVAELRGLICSGPLAGESHTYGLVDELVPSSRELDRPDAVRELVVRFFAGHGPAAVADLTRWTRVTQTEVRAALTDLEGQLEHLTVDGEQLWFDPAVDRSRRADRSVRADRRAFLLPVFDEAYLTYKSVNLPRIVDCCLHRSDRGRRPRARLVGATAVRL